MVRNPQWERDELILALDLYFRSDFSANVSRTPEKVPDIVELGNVLNGLPIHSMRPDAEHYRNPNGVYMKMCNFLRLDPDYPGKGLDAGSKRDEEVWNEFAKDRHRLHQIADAIRRNIQTEDAEKTRIPVIGDEEAAEGKLLYRLHILRERNQAIIRRRKQIALDRFGILACEVCGFDFRATYGELGDGFIECHHTIPLSLLGPGKPTRISDLALVCSNCHRMLHKGRSVLTIEGLRQLMHTPRAAEHHT